uniref:RNA-dependent RNA polymerase n=1 Tax=Hubei reo-like virus 7 TaxID=1923182 RepID=A0A3Q8U712_9VIRU|nr:RNA-dependent RNA polymerase [Hubei reo-like virus 7]
MNTSTLQNIEMTVHYARTNRLHLHEYLMRQVKQLLKDGERHGTGDCQSLRSTGVSFRTTPYSVEGLSSFGVLMKVTIQAPATFTHPIKFSKDMYPLNENESNFKIDRPNNYLCNFDWYAFLNDEIVDCPDKIKSAMLELINNSSQTRFSNIWINVLAVHLYFHTYDLGHDLVNLMHWILNGWDELPFHDVDDTFKDVLPGTSTMWPAMIYKYLSVCFDYICGNVTQIEALMAFQVALNQAEFRYQDTKLLTKNAYTLGIKVLLDDLPPAPTPIFTASGAFQSEFIKDTSEIWDDGEKESRLKEMKEKVDPIFWDFFLKVKERIKTVEDVIRFDTIARCFRGDRMYEGTLIDLAVRDAVEPSVHGPGVPAPKPTLYDKHDTSLIYDARYPADSFMSKVQEFYDLYIEILANQVDLRDPDNQFINYLSTSSAGYKLPMPDEILKRIHNKKFQRLLAKVGGKRVVQAALNVKSANSMENFTEMTLAQTTAIVRKQVERRQRLIASINNTNLENGYPTYLANKAFSAVHDAAEHGKQTGNWQDLFKLLRVTTNNETICSSQDIKGMDTSVQLAVAKNQQFGAMKILNGKTVDSGPFVNTVKECLNEYGDTVMVPLNGAQQRIAYAEKLGTKVTVTKSKIFGELPNKEGAFPSGQLNTSNHHTQFLILAFEAAILQWTNEHKFAIGMSHLGVMGDDVAMALVCRIDTAQTFLSYLRERMFELGFVVEQDESMNMITFLQQQVINGRFNGFANRITPFTREDHKVRKSIPESCAEMQAVFDDLVARVYDPAAMLRFHRIFAFVTLSKHVMLVPTNKYDQLVKILSKYVKVFTYELNKDTSKQDMRFLGFQIPYTYFFLHGGGSIPPESFERLDGTYTKEYEITSPKGEVLRRFLYDLSNSGDLNQEVLAMYNINVAYFFIDTKWLTVKQDVRDETIDHGIVNSLARNLESLEKGDRRETSRRAHAMLATLGVKVPRASVYGYQINERIKKTLVNVEESVDEVKAVSSIQVELLLRKLHNYKVKSYHTDKHHKFYMEGRPAVSVKRTPEYFALAHTSLTKAMWPGSPLHNLYVRQDHVPDASGAFATALAHSQGHFKNFKYDREAFQLSVKLASQHPIGSIVMNLFFEAINATEKVQATWIQAIEYYLQYKDYVYPFSTNPRCMFYIDERADSVMPLIDVATLPASVHERALAVRQSYVYFTSHVTELEDNVFHLIYRG